jgi:hypothetical protein
MEISDGFVFPLVDEIRIQQFDLIKPVETNVTKKVI